MTTESKPEARKCECSQPINMGYVDTMLDGRCGTCDRLISANPKPEPQVGIDPGIKYDLDINGKMIPQTVSGKMEMIESILSESDAGENITNQLRELLGAVEFHHMTSEEFLRCLKVWKAARAKADGEIQHWKDRFENADHFAKSYAQACGEARSDLERAQKENAELKAKLEWEVAPKKAAMERHEEIVKMKSTPPAARVEGLVLACTEFLAESYKVKGYDLQAEMTKRTALKDALAPFISAFESQDEVNRG